MRFMKKTWVPIFLIFIFILPLIASWVLFAYHDYFHFKTMNYGHLITPPIQVKNAEQKWQMLYFSKNRNVKHETILHSLVQIKKALGKDSERVIVNTMLQWQNSENVGPRLDRGIQNGLSGSRGQAAGRQNLLEDKIYLMDPMGNVFMYYDDGENPMHILKDLKKVLGVSQIG